MVTLFTNSDPVGTINSGLHLDMVTLGPTWVSPGHGESDPHLVDSRSHVDIMWTWWLQCF